MREDKNQYFFSDFTEENYRRILELAICNGYKFITYGGAHKNKGRTLSCAMISIFLPKERWH